MFSSSTVFILPNGGKRSPDVAWVSNERWDSLTLEEQEKFAPVCPDFVIELRSRTDSLNQLQSKMQEYLNSGLKLGWLIDPQNQQLEIYRQNKAREIVLWPTTLSGENILPGLSLDLPLFEISIIIKLTMMTRETIILNLKSVGLSDEQFCQLCQVNDQWRLEETVLPNLVCKIK